MPSHAPGEPPILAGGWSEQLEPEELIRYGRHLALPEFGTEGQRRLKGARVAVVGVGGLGCPAVLYLAAAGVGLLGLIDGDRVDRSNLQRQVLFGDDDVGERKVDVAARLVSRLNSRVEVRSFGERLDSGNALDVLRGFDVVIDASDNFPTRYLVNDAAGLLGIPTAHGSVLRFEGRVSVFGVSEGPCYRCIYPEPPPPGVVRDCQDAGVLGVLPGLVGVLQATEAIKLACGLGTTLAGRLLIIDGLGTRFREFQLQRNPACPLCGTHEIQSLIDYEDFCARGALPPAFESLGPAQVAQRIAAGAQVVDVREPWEWEICRLPNARLAPLARLGAALEQLDPRREVVLYCHRGVRSADAARRLLAAGFERVAHLEGGIDRWSVELDPGVARY